MDKLKIIKEILDSGSVISSGLHSLGQAQLKTWTINTAEKILQLRNYTDERKYYLLAQLLILSGAISRLAADNLKKLPYSEVTARVDLVTKIVRCLPLVLDKDGTSALDLMKTLSKYDVLGLILSKITFK
jgi:hypothetical protein